MADVHLKGIRKEYGSVLAVTDVDLNIPAGKLVCFLGPSGCGKTTLLRIIAGLESPTKGRLIVDGQDITDLPTHRRNFGMVFQSLALFGHLTVGENIAYALRVRGVDPAARRRRVEELLELVQLPGIADRHVAQLSGGQRQRVAIARALAMEPKLFLMDEPLSALDAKLREAMQIELRVLQQRLDITTVMVTHDQREAMTMADQIVVMGDSRVQQVGSPTEIYRNPANRFVADFIGTSNLLPATMKSGTGVVVDGRPVRVSDLPVGLGDGAAVTLLVRPEEMRILPPDSEGENRLPGTVAFIRDVGATVETYVYCAGVRLVAIAMRRDRPEVEPGERALVELPPGACRILAA